MVDTADQTSAAFSDDSGMEYRRRQIRCGDFCAVNIFKIPVLILRNVLFPREEWDEYPNGFDRIADRLLFHPETSREYVPSPKEYDMPDYEEVNITTKDDVKLHAYLIKAALSQSDNDKAKADIPISETLDRNQNEVRDSSPTFPVHTKAPTIIYFHGNAGNVGYCCDLIKRLRDDPSLLACNWFLVDYRGYGNSDGIQTEKGLYRDARATFDYLERREDLDHSKFVLMGHSLGGAVAIYLASHKRYRKKIAALILENTFTSIPAMAKTLMKALIALPLCCYSAKFQSIQRISRVSKNTPTLFLVGKDDDIVPNDMSHQLFKKCKAKVKFIQEFDDSGHNDTSVNQACVPVLGNFIQQHVICPESGGPTSTATVEAEPAVDPLLATSPQPQLIEPEGDETEIIEATGIDNVTPPPVSA